MRKAPNIEVEPYRAKNAGAWSSRESDGNNGAFLIPHKGILLSCIVSDQGGWDHASVTVRDRKGKQIKRTPTWEELCEVRDLFWGEDEVVMQLHPRHVDHVNVHNYCLHLWKPQKESIPQPPKIFV